VRRSPDGKRSGVAQLVRASLGRERGRLVVIAGALAVLGAAQGLFLLLVKGFVQALFQGDGQPVAVTTLLPESVLRYLPQWGGVYVAPATLAVAVPLAIAVAGLGKAIATYVYQWQQQSLALAVARDLRLALFERLLAQPYETIRGRSAGEWMSVVMNDVMFVQQRFSDIMTGLVRDSVILVACFVTLAFIHAPTAAVLVAVAPVIAWTMGRTGRRIARYAEAFQRELARLAAAFLDLRARFDFIRAQHGEAREKERFDALNVRYYRMIRRSILVRSAFAPVLEFVGFTLFAVCIYAIGRGIWGAGLTADVMMQFFVALGLLLKPLKEMGEQLTRLAESKGVLAQSEALLSVSSSPARLSAATAGVGDPSADARRARALGMTVRMVEAAQGGATRIKAHDISLSPGRTVAIIGPSGGGKSTLVKTLAGLLPPKTWDADVPWEELARQTSMVSQEPFFFDDTLSANLSYGSAPGQVPSEAAQREAVAAVGLGSELAAMPDGLATRVRALGSNVSGGQLQRLVIARGLLRQKPVLLLDEATSAVDAAAEQAITLGLIQRAKANQTVLVAVTHRLTWLASFDEVWFVEDGALKHKGGHADLLAHQRYREFCAGGGAS
jgi:ABC-type multidrug transport system fused ATPase/permease subunit